MTDDHEAIQEPELHLDTDLWLLDPVTQTLEVFALESGHWLLLANHGGNEVVFSSQAHK